MTITRMTMKEALKLAEKNRKVNDAMYKKAKPAPYVDDGIPPPKGIRGFANFMEHINRNGRPKVQDKKVTIAIRLPESVATELRTNKHYSRHIAEYVMKGLSSGRLKLSNHLHE